MGAVTKAVPEETDAKRRDSCQERCGVADACSSHTGGDASAKRGRTGIDEGWADDDKGGEEDGCGLHFGGDFWCLGRCVGWRRVLGFDWSFFVRRLIGLLGKM